MPIITRRRPSTGLVPFDLSALPWLPRMSNPIRVEECVEGQTYVLRAELPGIDPVHGIKIFYRDGALRLQIQRMDERKDKTHTEFRYGSYGRTVVLPEGTDARSIRATYSDGILEIRATMTNPQEAHRSIPIMIEEGAIEEGKPGEIKPAAAKPVETGVPELKSAEAKAVEPKPRAAKPVPARRTGNGTRH